MWHHLGYRQWVCKIHVGIIYWEEVIMIGQNSIGNAFRYVWYGSKFTLNQANVRYLFGHCCGLNMHTLRPSQDRITLLDYLRGLSPARQVLRFKWRQLQLQCHYKQNGSKSTAEKMVYFLHIKYVSYRQPSEAMLKIREHTQLQYNTIPYDTAT